MTIQCQRTCPRPTDAIAPVLALIAGLSLLAACQGDQSMNDQPPPDPDQPRSQPQSKPLQIIAREVGFSRKVDTAMRAVYGPGQPLPFDDLRTLRGGPTADRMVVLWALGPKPNPGYGVTIDRVALAGRTLVVTGRTTEPDPDRMYAQVISYPYAAVAVPEVYFERIRWRDASVDGDAD